MIKNYCIKIISSVFIMLTIFMVSTSVFASDEDIITGVAGDYTYTLDLSAKTFTISASDGSKSYDVANILNLKNYVLLLDYNATNDVKFYLYGSDSDFKWLYHSGSMNVGYFLGFESNELVHFLGEVKYLATTRKNSIYGTYTEYTSVNYSQPGKFYAILNGAVYPPDTSILYATDTITNPLNSSENIYAAEKSIIYQVNYSEDNKTAILSAEIKNSAEGDKLYYSTLGYSLTGKLMNPIELNQSQATAITLNKNTMIHLQALDSER